ncbi:chymotrypsin family serine protease [Angustibacter luteus]|uniref:Serine protease n=1 Tax=Angustibacter luteus TaxID=658456 RepID=A0ABW1JHS1_9ACTN
MRRSTKTIAVCLSAAAAAALAVGTGPAQAASSDPASAKGVPVARTRAIPDSASPDHLAAKAAASAPASRRAVATVQARVADYVATHGTRYSFGTYSDPVTGAVVVDTDAPSAVIGRLITLTGDRTTAGIAVKVTRQRTTDRLGRGDDTPPFYGGGGLSAPGAVCSTGYTVQSAAGTRWMITAGHCYPNGTVVMTPSGANTVGTVTGRTVAPVDAEFLAGKTYAGRLFTGGVNSAASIPVVGAGSAVVGYSSYCHSGYKTGEQCGHTVTSTTAQLCTATGCKFPVIAYTGGVIALPGDSGAPFYAKTATQAWVRGHVIAGNATTGYVEPYTEITKHWAVKASLG